MKSKGILVMLCLLALTINGTVIAQTPEDNLAIYKTQFDAMNAHDLDTMMSYWADDSMWDIASSPAPAPKAYVEIGLAQRFAASPDFHMTEGLTFAVDNIVVEESKTVYTVVDTGVEVVLPHISIYEFEGGLVKKVTSYNDLVGPMVTRGEMPAPEMPELVPSFTLPDPEPTGLSPLEAEAEAYARWNSGDLAEYAKMIHPDAEFFLGPVGVPMDKSANIAMHELYLQAFADRQAEILRTIDLGDGWVLSEVVYSGTHTGDYFGIPATGRLFRLRGVSLERFDAQGLITNLNVYFDNLTLITQITTDEWPLDGIWITTYPTPMGNLISSTVYVAQDAAKTRYSGTLEWINSLPLFTELFPDSDPALDKSAGGEAVKVGRHQYKATFLGYYRKLDISASTLEIDGIWIADANFELLGPDQIQGHGTASYYMAAQDADQDGFPDEGQEPVACVPWTWTGKRLTLMPACELAPMPEPGQ
ncbi:MAG: nuclear transport factor 2 family protein [Phycisphaerae bacterium]|nr:nuclear transport factor 2 family protein [Phycisphaerae bacterium]